MIDISNIVNITVSQDNVAVAGDNMNAVMIVTSKPVSNILNSNNRYAIYKNVNDVATDFGSDSLVYAHALSFFSTDPNPIQANGYLIVGYWRASNEVINATAPLLTGGALNTSEVISSLRNVTKGGYSITYDSTTTYNSEVLDFSNISSINDIINIINASFNAGSVPAIASFKNNRIVITGENTGASHSLSYLAKSTTSGVESDISTFLKLQDGTGAILKNGADQSTLQAESKVDALNNILKQTNYKGFVFIDSVTNDEVLQIASWCKANEKISYDVFSDTSNLEISNDNPVWNIKLNGYTYYRCLYDKTNNRQLATSYMSRMHTVNFSVINSALTMQFKQLSVNPCDYSNQELMKTEAVGLDIYTTIKNVGVVLTSGANDFTDNVYNLEGYKNALETNIFNLLLQGNKIPQTNSGVSSIISVCSITTNSFVNAGVIARGLWSRSDYFGDKQTFMNAIANTGFYILADLSAQSAEDRANRKSPPIMIAFKLAGAIHSVDVIARVNI